MSGIRSQRLHLPEGDPGVELTLREMVRLVERALRNPEVIQMAHDVVRFVPERQPDLTANAILQFVRAHMRYTDDPWDRSGGKELVKAPEVLVREIRTHGKAVMDCDDAVSLTLALLGAAGIPSEPVVVAAAGDFGHVLVRYANQNGWNTMDPIVRSSGLGWFPPGATRVGLFHKGRFTTGRQG